MKIMTNFEKAIQSARDQNNNPEWRPLLEKRSNIEELLKPRYKIVASWPDMANHGYFINQIIKLPDFDSGTNSGLSKAE